MDSPVNSAEDLAKQTKIKYGTYCCGSTNAFFQSSTIPTYQKLNAFMESAKPSVYTKGNSQGLDIYTYVSTLLENLFDNANAYLYGTKFSTIFPLFD